MSQYVLNAMDQQTLDELWAKEIDFSQPGDGSDLREADALRMVLLKGWSSRTRVSSTAVQEDSTLQALRAGQHTMAHIDFEKTVLTALRELMDTEGLRRVESSGERMFSTVSVGNQNAGIQVVVEWRDSYVQVDAYRCIGGNPPPPSSVATSPYWLSLKEVVELSGIHPLEEPQLTASARSDDETAASTEQDLEAYLADLVPLLTRLCTPWFRGNLESFDALVRAREALLAEPEPGGAGAKHWSWTEDMDVSANTPVFVAGVLEACGPLRGAGWRDIWYAATPRKLAVALTHPNGQVGVEIRAREPRPPDAQVELLLLDAGRPPPYERIDRRVAIRWALEHHGAAVPELSRKDGVGLYKFVGDCIATLARSSPEFLSGDGRVVQKAQIQRDQLGESLGAEFR